MKAIILAAGVGRRLGMDLPKCMLDVGGMSIIHRQLAVFRSVGVEEFVIVVGYEQERLISHLDGQPGRFTFIDNPHYRRTNTILSLYLARQHLVEGACYANADVVFDRRLMQRLFACPTPTGLAVLKKECGREEVKVVVDNGRIVRIGKEIPAGECWGEFVGLARFGTDIAAAFEERLTHLVETEQRVGDYFESALDPLCSGHQLTAVDVTGLPCQEIDFPDDLASARRRIAPELSNQ